jgi:hypothetical protein
MIVVASHNNLDTLGWIVEDLYRIDLNNHEVCIIDTNSNNLEFKEKFHILRNKYPYFKFINLNYTCWDSGAYIWAYNNLKSERYIFLQDSLRILDKNYIKLIDQNLDLYDVVAHINFKYHYENEEQKNWVEDGILFNELPEDAIFGPIFGVKKTTLDKIPSYWLKHPTNKNEGCGMERRWSLMFNQIGASKKYLEIEDIPNEVTIYNTRKYIHKLFYHRL